MGEARRSDWADHAHRVLRDAGYRQGAARGAVIDLLACEPCALTATEIEERLRSGHGGRRASIYRTLEVLVGHGLVRRLQLGHGPAHYEALDHSGEHHHHLVCEGCGGLVAFQDPALDAALRRIAGRLDADVHDHQVVLRGACGRCVPRARVT